jgi:branched-chain amino acid transport system substrate-binding protein
MSLIRILWATAVFGIATTGAQAEIKVGVNLSMTGPVAASGIAEARILPLLPKEIDGEPVRYILLDDRTDTTTGVQNIKKLILEDSVDVIIGPGQTAVTLAITDLTTSARVPVINLSGSALTVEPADKKPWIFKVPQNDGQMATAIVEHMRKTGVKTVGVLIANDAYGEGWLNVIKGEFDKAGIAMLASERYARSDTSVTGQMLKIIAANPDAVFIASSGAPAALPVATARERGYRGTFYQTHGVLTNDYIKIGGQHVEGSYAPAGPVLVANELPDTHPSKAAGVAFLKKSAALPEKEEGQTNFGAYMWDAGLLFSAAAKQALKKGKPGSVEFRAAMRDALENTRQFVTTNGVVNMSPSNHQGLGEEARVLVVLKNGVWTLVK